MLYAATADLTDFIWAFVELGTYKSWVFCVGLVLNCSVVGNCSATPGNAEGGASLEWTSAGAASSHAQPCSPWVRALDLTPFDARRIQLMHKARTNFPSDSCCGVHPRVRCRARLCFTWQGSGLSDTSSMPVPAPHRCLCIHALLERQGALA